MAALERNRTYRAEWRVPGETATVCAIVDVYPSGRVNYAAIKSSEDEDGWGVFTPDYPVEQAKDVSEVRYVKDLELEGIWANQEGDLLVLSDVGHVGVGTGTLYDSWGFVATDRATVNDLEAGWRHVSAYLPARRPATRHCPSGAVTAAEEYDVALGTPTCASALDPEEDAELVATLERRRRQAWQEAATRDLALWNRNHAARRPEWAFDPESPKAWWAVGQCPTTFERTREGFTAKVELPYGDVLEADQDTFSRPCAAGSPVQIMTVEALRDLVRNTMPLLARQLGGCELPEQLLQRVLKLGPNKATQAAIDAGVAAEDIFAYRYPLRAEQLQLALGDVVRKEEP